MRDIRHPGLILTDDMTLHIFELPKFEKIPQFTEHSMCWKLSARMRQSAVREDALRNERSELFYTEKRGEFIGKINLAQRLLKRPVTPKNDLIGKSLKDPFPIIFC